MSLLDALLCVGAFNPASGGLLPLAGKNKKKLLIPQNLV
jgi:hypothetical protein